jgi:hypothetical protein
VHFDAPSISLRETAVSWTDPLAGDPRNPPASQYSIRIKASMINYGRVPGMVQPVDERWVTFRYGTDPNDQWIDPMLLEPNVKTS